MAKAIVVGARIASKVSKSWGKRGKVVKVSGTSTSKKYDVTWDDGSITLAGPSAWKRILGRNPNRGRRPPRSQSRFPQELLHLTKKPRQNHLSPRRAMPASNSTPTPSDSRGDHFKNSNFPISHILHTVATAPMQTRCSHPTIASGSTTRLCLSTRKQISSPVMPTSNRRIFSPTSRRKPNWNIFS